MKKQNTISKQIGILLLAIAVMFSFTGCGEKEVADPINDAIQVDLETYFLDTHYNESSCFVSLYTYVSDEAQDDIEVEDVFIAIDTDRENEYVKFTLMEISRPDIAADGTISSNGEMNYTTYNKAWYLDLTGDTVTLYTPNEELTNNPWAYNAYTYSSQEIEDSELATVIRTMFFPENLDHIKGTFVSSTEDYYNNEDFAATMTTRTIPFSLVTDILAKFTDEPVPTSDEPNISIVSFSKTPQVEGGYNVYAKITMDSYDIPSEYIQYMYETITGEPYEPIYITNGYDYYQNISIAFFDHDDTEADEPIVLPDAQ